MSRTDELPRRPLAATGLWFSSSRISRSCVSCTRSSSSISGFDVIEAGNGVDAIAHTTSHAPDVVLMDLSLPVLDGWEATRRLKSDARTAHIPVVALTAHDGSGELQRATRAGCDWFVPKPCPPDALITEVRRVLASRPS